MFPSSQRSFLDGLVALGTFLVDLGQAVVDWGMQFAGEVQAAAHAAMEKVKSLQEGLRVWVLQSLRQKVRSIWSGHSSSEISFISSDPNGQFVASSLANADPTMDVVGTLTEDVGFVVKIFLSGGPVLSRVPRALDAVLFLSPFIVMRVVSWQDVVDELEAATRQETGVLPSFDANQQKGLYLLVAGWILADIGSHLILKGAGVSILSAGTAAPIGAGEVIIGWILDGIGIALMLYGLLIIVDVLPPPW